MYYIIQEMPTGDVYCGFESSCYYEVLEHYFGPAGESPWPTYIVTENDETIFVPFHEDVNTYKWYCKCIDCKKDIKDLQMRSKASL